MSEDLVQLANATREVCDQVVRLNRAYTRFERVEKAAHDAGASRAQIASVMASAVAGRADRQAALVHVLEIRKQKREQA